MASKQVILDLDRRLVRLISVMADEDCRSLAQQIAWLIRKEAVRRKLIEDNGRSTGNTTGGRERSDITGNGCSTDESNVVSGGPHRSS